MNRTILIFLYAFVFSVLFMQSIPAQESPLIIYFEKGSSTLSKANREQLKVLVEILNVKELYRFRVEGHADTCGTAAFNLSLSKKRAEAVAEFLKTCGFSKASMDVSYFGESLALHIQPAYLGDSMNRRVEIIWEEVKHPRNP